MSRVSKRSANVRHAILSIVIAFAFVQACGDVTTSQFHGDASGDVSLDAGFGDVTEDSSTSDDPNVSDTQNADIAVDATSEADANLADVNPADADVGETSDDACSWAVCQKTPCGPITRACGDCVDNDLDGRLDMDDPECLSPCANSEAAMAHAIPACDAPNPCSQDCYFDGDCGPGNDDCYWDVRCDSAQPLGSTCPFDPNTDIYGTPATCTQLGAAQSAICTTSCLPLVPNGCDCFGCCEVEPGRYAFVGSSSYGYDTCNSATASDPTKCLACTPTPSCLNACEPCEICVGQPKLAPSCGGVQKCAAGAQPCGLPCQAPCPQGKYCLTGCCASLS